MIENLYGEARRTDSQDAANPGELSVVAQLANLASPYAIRVAATLRLADLIEAQPRRLDELAAASGANPDALGRLMRFLTCRGVFAEPEPGVFSMTESARILTSNHPMQVRGWFDLDGPAAGRMDVSFTRLLDSVRTGETAYSKLFGRPVWEDFEDSPDLAASFGELMASRAASFAPDVVKCYDWNDVTHVIDVGGGAGLLLRELLHGHPAMMGTLVDLPAMASLAEATFEAAGLSRQTSVVAGNLFDPLSIADREAHHFAHPDRGEGTEVEGERRLDICHLALQRELQVGECVHPLLVMSADHRTSSSAAVARTSCSLAPAATSFRYRLSSRGAWKASTATRFPAWK